MKATASTWMCQTLTVSSVALWVWIRLEFIWDWDQKKKNRRKKKTKLDQDIHNYFTSEISIYSVLTLAVFLTGITTLKKRDGKEILNLSFHHTRTGQFWWFNNVLEKIPDFPDVFRAISRGYILPLTQLAFSRFLLSHKEKIRYLICWMPTSRRLTVLQLTTTWRIRSQSGLLQLC